MNIDDFCKNPNYIDIEKNIKDFKCQGYEKLYIKGIYRGFYICFEVEEKGTIDIDSINRIIDDVFQE